MRTQLYIVFYCSTSTYYLLSVVYYEYEENITKITNYTVCACHQCVSSFTLCQ